MAIARKRYKDGEKNIYHFVLSKNWKALADFVTTALRMEDPPATVERANKPQLDNLKDHLNNRYTESCSREWFRCVKEVLVSNGYNAYVYVDSMWKCLDKGQQKGNNIILVDQTNCRKFLLDSLEMIFNKFAYPTSASYVLCLHKCEIAYLNDFRHSKECIKWSDFLLLLDGSTSNLAWPKN